MWRASRRAQDRLNDYWNALARRAPADELARLRAQIDPELTATIDSAIALHRRRRPDLAFGDRLEGDLMNAFAVSSGGTAVVPPVRPRSTNGNHEQWTPAKWIPSLGQQPAHRRFGLVQLGLVALLLLTLVGGYFVYSNQSDHPVVIQQGTPVSTPTADWTNTRGDAGRTGLGASGPVGQPLVVWRFQADGPCDTSPAAVGDTVFSACGNGILYAIDRATGTERWQYSAQSPVVGGPLVAEGLVVLVDADGRLYGIDAETGEQVWLAEGTFYGAPVARDGIIAVGGFDGQLAAIDLATGQERWRYLVEDGGEAKNPAIGDGIVYSGSIANGFSAVDLQTGELVWHADTDGIETGTAVVANGVAYIGSAPGVPEGFLNAYDAETGDLLWSSDEPIFSPAVKDGTGFAGSADGPVTAIDLATGEVLWQVTVGGVARPAVVAGDVVYMNSDGDETIYAFDTATGDELWSFPVDGYLGDAGALKDGMLYVNTGGGSIYAIGGENAIPAAGTTAGSPEPAAIAAATVVASPAAAALDLLAADVLWTATGGDGGFDRPGRVAINPSSGQIWVIDNRNHRFQIFDADGNFIETWGEQGKGDGQFQMMLQNQAIFTDIEFANDGSFAVLDPGNGRVQTFGPDRQFLSSFGEFGTGAGEFVLPIDLAIGPDGTYWVTDEKRQDAQQFDADGNVLSSFRLPESYYFSWDHLVDEQGNHYLTVAKEGGNQTTFEILELASDGTLARIIGAPSADIPIFTSELTELAFDAEDRLFVGSGFPADSSIYVFGPDGGSLGHLDAGGIVQGLAIDASGDLYVLNSSDGTLSKLRLSPSAFAPDAPTLLWTTPGGDTGLSKPSNITIAADGNLWVADNANHQFQIFSPNGTFLETWGEQGKGDGQFQLLEAKEADGYAKVAFASDGSFYVLDPGNFRVQQFAPDRSFVRTWGAFGAEPAQFRSPVGLALDADGTVWVFDADRHDVQHFDANGNLLGAFDAVDGDGNTVRANGMINGPDGNLYLSAYDTSMANGQVLVFAPDGTLVTTIGQGTFGGQAALVAFDTAGRLYATEVDNNGPNGQVHIFDTTGTLVTSLPVGGYPVGIVVGANGEIIVTDYLDGTLTGYAGTPAS